MRFIEFLIESEHKARAQEVATFIKNEVLPRFQVTPSRSRLSPNPQNRSQYLLTLDADTRNLHDADKQAMDELLSQMGARVRKLVVRSRRQRIQFVIDPAEQQVGTREVDLDDVDDLRTSDDEDRVVDVGDEDDFEPDYDEMDRREFNDYRDFDEDRGEGLPSNLWRGRPGA